ncbi:DUF2561 family protein [Candidatus Mycolicibacterium alkanivorans]|uniref:DUF2561 family protein n=1 Tax=Candidatus Mycolicibacterium alkanivorans TaxID=2954114 RepID=A0ABS9YW13_9MYCO|nr:DUF2561 family protein [Candidatus Mycolicibacterium alkanivorans]MCI4675390.1 DUF2561 family protein [Candidatus Mycolicibacterium alkanivorans]
MARESEVAVVGTQDDDRSPETVDRVLVGVCGAIWLVLLAVTVIAIVALVDLGRGHTIGGEGKHTTWVLYSVIAVSALIIVGAIPLLIRARRAAQAVPVLPAAATATKAAAPPPQTPAAAPVRPTEAPTEKLKVFGATVDPYEPYQPAFAQSSATRRADLLIPATELDRLWLRGTITLLGAIGLALVGVSLATYLLAVDNQTGAWVALGLAAVVTVAMPVLPVFYLRQLHAALDEAQAE